MFLFSRRSVSIAQIMTQFNYLSIKINTQFCLFKRGNIFYQREEYITTVILSSTSCQRLQNKLKWKSTEGLWIILIPYSRALWKSNSTHCYPSYKVSRILKSLFTCLISGQSVESRLQVKMNSPDPARDISIKQEEPEDISIKQEEPEDHPHLSKLCVLHIVLSIPFLHIISILQ